MLKKGMLCAGAIAVAAAGVSTGVLAADAKGGLYGDIRWSLDYAEDNSAAPGPSYNATDNNSFWGVKASASEGSLKAFGAYERFLDNDAQVFFDLVRQSYAGLSTGFGTVMFGQFETAYYKAGRKVDLFYDTAVTGIGGVAASTSLLAAGNSHGQSADLNGNFVGSGISANQLAYTSPSFAGVTVNAAFFMDDSTTGSAAQDHDYGVGAEFNNFGITAGVQVLDLNSANTNFATVGPREEAFRVYGGYAAERWGAMASAEKLDRAGGAIDEDYYMVSGWFGVTESTRLAASFGRENESGAEGNSIRVGVFQDVIENFTVWAAARRYDDHQGVGAPFDTDVVTLGASYKFDIGVGGK